MPNSLNATVSINYKADDLIHRGSGVLLAGGNFVLTSAHLFNHYSSPTELELSTPNGNLPEATDVYIHHGWTQNNRDFNHDIALIALSSPITTTEGITLWDGGTLEGKIFTLSGFDTNGSLHSGTNTFDGDGALLNNQTFRNVMPGTQIIYDYDNGLIAHDAIGQLLGLGSTGATDKETLARPGNSGGPLLVDNKIAALSSYIYRTDTYDSNSIADSSAGEIGFATQITPYLPWINAITQGNPDYPQPTSKDEVLTEIDEPFFGEVTNYFLLELAFPLATDVSLWFSTSDGTATAGEDYVSTEGWTTIEAGKRYSAIGVTILGDTNMEENETFHLTVSDPSGKWMNEGVELIATHTIINNDLVG